MPTPLSITIEPDLNQVTAHLKKYAENGGKELKKQLARDMRTLGDRVVKAEQAAALRTSIKGVKGGGGLRHRRGGMTRGTGKGIRRFVAQSIIRRNRLSGKEVGVEIRASKSRMPPGMENIPKYVDSGGWRHPVFGDRGNWADQAARPAGFFLGARDEMKPVIQREIRALAEKYMKEALKLGA